jgi:serine/threonine protein phosphatase PrpC
VRAALLRGRDHVTAGAVGEAAEGSVAAAISRGGAPKPYPHTDPNEDAVLCASGERGLVVAVADGHWGCRAAELALARLLEAHVADWTEGRERAAERWYQEILAALRGMNEAILAGHRGKERSRTTLALALVRPEQDLVVTASVGDSHLFQVLDERVLDFGGSRSRRGFFLGQESVAASMLERDARIALHPVAGTLALVAATDGLSEEDIGVADPAAAVRAATAGVGAELPARRAIAAARALVETALAAHRENGAGDNVSAAVAWLDA